MIAQIIVNSVSKQNDKRFDYIIPKQLEDKVAVGIRVSVPFGKSNKKHEGYVVGIKENSNAKNLKALYDAEEIPLFNEKMLELIEWMREKYICSYIDAIRVIVPSGTNIKFTRWLILEDISIPLTKKEEKIVELIKANGNECEFDRVIEYFEDENVKPQIKALCDKGVLKEEYKDKKAVKDKYVKMVKLIVSDEEAKEMVVELKRKRAVAQAKILEVLLSTDIICVADLLNISQCGYNSVLALKNREVIEFYEKEVYRTHKRLQQTEDKKEIELTKEQELCCEKICKNLSKENFSEILLHGVTGSGKTEVFLKSISEVIKKGKKAIVLVPEISLTPQMMDRFISRFGDRVAVFHSGLSLGEKYDEWKKMRDNKTDIVIGARSAIFAPFDDIGIIIMDEEHEATYKSEVLPRYDTKEVAKFRCMQNNAVLVYASATPDVKTYYKAVNKKIDLINLNKRINKNPLPQVNIVDMRQELSEGNKSIFSRLLIENIEQNLKNKEQTILFLNRRGFSTFVSCRNCGFVANCPNCNISLTYHKMGNTLKCHYCGYTRDNYSICPKCKSKYIRYFGGGTQKVEEEIKKIFPNASTIRMDVDTTSKNNSHEKLLYEFSKNKTDILIGTQMVAKGLDFPDVTLVGVVSADTMLNIDDYRSAERSFDLLEQVTGRAGRANKKGRAIIQTYSPEHDAVVFASMHEYLEFYNREIAIRQVMKYPPFCEMISVLFTGSYENIVSQCAKYFAKQIQDIKKDNVNILGPVPALITKIKNKYRWRILIKCPNADLLGKKLVDAINECNKNKNFEKVIIVIDKNPNNIY